MKIRRAGPFVNELLRSVFSNSHLMLSNEPANSSYNGAKLGGLQTLLRHNPGAMLCANAILFTTERKDIL